ncbi:MAG: GNAT family N-acetyltransferase [Epulopiscium sp.]|nr:GNAT family N-acetyltransferase [Candidatus Epulonipiscium sp.]
MIISKITSKDIQSVAQLANIMWSNSTIEELESDFKEIMKDKNVVVFVATEKEEVVGFAQCQLRYDYVEGTNSSPVGYLEGIFIRQECRHKGYAKELLKYCEKWSVEKGCKEFASDCELTNETSFKFHLSMGFSEANRIICFTKQL